MAVPSVGMVWVAMLLTLEAAVKSSYHAGTKHVDGTLQDHGSDCCDGIV